MLKKLFKHEWKSFWKVPTTINVCLVILTIIGIISMVSPFWTLDYEIMDTLMISAVMIYYVAILAGSIAVMVYIAIRYYKSIYTDEGYLTNTLPVTPRQIILSKAFVSYIWSLITSIVITISVLVLLYFALLSYADINIIHELAELWEEFTTLTDAALKSDVILLFVAIILSLLISPLFSNATVFASIALGQLFKKHKVAGAVMWYIAQYIILELVASSIMSVPLFDGLNAADKIGSSPIPIVNLFLFGTILCSIIGTIAFHFIAEFMLKKKLNLD